jgi:hypothetical protein
MKKLLVLLALYFIPQVWADTYKEAVFSTVRADNVIDLRKSGVYNHRITWTGSGTRSTCTMKVEKSATGTGDWTDLIAGQDCTTNGTATATEYVNFARISVTVLSGAGNTVYSQYQGTIVQPSIGQVEVSTEGLASDTTLADVVTATESIDTKTGPVEANPAAPYSVLGRLKSVEDKLDLLLATYTDGKAHVISDPTSVSSVSPAAATTWSVSPAAAADFKFKLWNGTNDVSLTNPGAGSVFAAAVQIMDSNGDPITTFGGAGGTSSNFGSAFPTPGTAIGFSDGTNMVAGRVEQVGGKNAIVVTTLDTNGDPISGYLDSSTDSVEAVISSSHYGTAGSGSENVFTFQGAAGGTPVPVSGTFWQETQPVSGTVTVTLPGGATPYSYISTASANQINVKASAGTLFTVTALNMTATVQYLLLFDKATAPDQSACNGNSDCPVMYFPIPTQADTNGAGFSIPLGPLGIEFANGLGFSIIGSACGEVATCVNETNAAAGVVLSLGYK